MTETGGQVILITGATDGLARAVALELARQGATVLLHGRDRARTAETLAMIERETGNPRLSVLLADFDELDQVRALAEQVLREQPRLDVLVNNAGLGVDPVRQVTSDGLEATFQVDYLAPYMLSYLLEELLVRSAPARIVNVTSAGQAPLRWDDLQLEHSYDGVQAYCQAKLAEVMLTLDRAEELAGTGVTVNCLHPASYMPTKIVTHMFTPESSIADGVESTLRLITDPALAGVSGRYFFMTREQQAHQAAYDPLARARLRGIAEQLTGVRATAPEGSADPGMA